MHSWVVLFPSEAEVLFQKFPGTPGGISLALLGLAQFSFQLQVCVRLALPVSSYSPGGSGHPGHVLTVMTKVCHVMQMTGEHPKVMEWSMHSSYLEAIARVQVTNTITGE